MLPVKFPIPNLRLSPFLTKTGSASTNNVNGQDMAKDNVYLHGVKFYKDELWRLYNVKKIFFVKYDTVYQLHWSSAQATFFASEVYRNMNPKPLLKRGQHGFFTAADVNKLIGHEVFVEV